MATTRKSEPKRQLTVVEARKKVEDLQDKIEKLKNSAFCLMCRIHKDRETKFYVNTNPIYGGTTCTPICRECARKIALRVDKNGEEHEPTKESVINALKALDKPFKNTVWNASIQETENLVSGKVKANVWNAYIRIIQMVNYVGETYLDSDFFKEKELYEDEEPSSDDTPLPTGMDTYDDYLKNKEDVKRLLSYDPFEFEAVADQPFLYSQLLGLLDSSEDANEDMMRTASAISIVRGFLQQAKIDNTIASLMTDVKNIERNYAAIKSLQESKGKITSVITSLAQDSCISLKHNKNAKKGENTWTGKIKKLKDLALREGEINGFDMETCKAMRQVMDSSNSSIMKQLALDESEWSDIVAEQRTTIVKLQDDVDKYTEITRILLRENMDIKDTLKERDIDLDIPLVNLNKIFSAFSQQTDEEGKDEDAAIK